MDNIIRKLENAREKFKDKRVSTFEINVYESVDTYKSEILFVMGVTDRI